MADKTAEKDPRPRAKDPRSHTLRVRLTTGELKKLQETARSSGRTVSDVVREAALRGTRSVPGSGDSAGGEGSAGDAQPHQCEASVCSPIGRIGTGAP